MATQGLLGLDTIRPAMNLLDARASKIDESDPYLQRYFNLMNSYGYGAGRFIDPNAVRQTSEFVPAVYDIPEFRPGRFLPIENTVVNDVAQPGVLEGQASWTAPDYTNQGLAPVEEAIPKTVDEILNPPPPKEPSEPAPAVTVKTDTTQVGTLPPSLLEDTTTKKVTPEITMNIIDPEGTQTTQTAVGEPVEIPINQVAEEFYSGGGDGVDASAVESMGPIKTAWQKAATSGTLPVGYKMLYEASEPTTRTVTPSVGMIVTDPYGVQTSTESVGTPVELGQIAGQVSTDLQGYVPTIPESVLQPVDLTGDIDLSGIDLSPEGLLGSASILEETDDLTPDSRGEYSTRVGGIGAQDITGAQIGEVDLGAYLADAMPEIMATIPWDYSGLPTSDLIADALRGVLRPKMGLGR